MSFKSKVYIALKSFLSKQNIALIKFTLGDKPKVFSLIKKIKNEKHFLLRYSEAYNIYSIVKNTAKIPGDIAEIGTFNGASAKLISEIKGNKSLYVFDSFEGLPETIDIDAKQFHKGQFSSDFDVVKKYLSQYKNVHVYKGFFPQHNSEKISDKKFSFVHLDVDLYESTIDSLKFFYSRMSKGGCIISHDYYAEGVFKAFEEFFSDKPEPIIELPEDQVLIVKL
jgi:predicted O-methyltransferase YrrM